MIAALPMYDRAETAAAHDLLWAGTRDALRAAGHPAPDRLTRDPDLWRLWRAPDLVLAQTCGLPYRARLHRHVTLIATPDYGVEGCPPGFYRSLLVVHADDPRADLGAFDGARLAVNDAVSQSGWAAAQAHLAAAGIACRPCGPTGSHAASARAVARGAADIAAIDAVTWRLMARAERWTDRLRVLEGTAPAPGLPLIAGPGADRATVLAALHAGLAALPEAARDTLGLRGLVEIPAAVYLAQTCPPAPWAEPG